MKKNLVMGVAAHYDWYALEPFVNSCKKNCPSADLLLFVDDLSDFTRDKLIRGGVIIEDIPAECKDILIVNSRWKMYSDFLDEYGDNYEHVFLTDIRDVIFQSDLFEGFKNHYNYLCYATEDVDFRGSIPDYHWFASRFGNAEADKLLDKKVICAGTVLGTVNAIKIFLSEMQNLVKDHNFWGHDQSAMTHLIYNHLLPIENFIESDIADGVIFTTSYAKRKNIFTRGDKICYNKNIPAVFHQYTLYEHLIQFAHEIYCDKNFQADERFNDTRSIIEQTTALLQADRIGEATRLFLKKFLGKADFSNYGQSLLNIWRIALRKPLTQTLELLELALQNAATSVKNITDNFLNSLCNNLKRAKEIGHPVDPDFKNYAANVLLGFGNHSLNYNQPQNCFWCIKNIEELDLPRGKNFYLLVAKANRLAGKKDEALAAYKKVLEFD